MTEMRMHFQSLALDCRQSREVLVFAENITFFHGDFGTGKSSVARLIDYCLGGGMEPTPAIQQELVAVSLTAIMGTYQVLFERTLRNHTRITVTWENEKGEGARVSAPINPGNDPIWEQDKEKLYNVNDIIYFLLGVSPPQVRKNSFDPEASLIRLSFRDMMWYCYLKQDDMESSFFKLDAPIIMSKSRNIVRYVLGFHTDRLNELEVDLEATRDEQRGKLATARQIRKFLEKHNFGSTQQILDQRGQVESELIQAREKQGGLREAQQSDTHFVDELRNRLRKLSDQLNQEQQALADLAMLIEDQESLRAELVATRFKLARTNAATTVLANVTFDACPSCGLPIKDRVVEDENACRLCLQVSPQVSDDEALSKVEALNQDLDNRIDELKDSIKRHKTAQDSQKQRIQQIQSDKSELDHLLARELSGYDSVYMARFREVEREVAMLEERNASLSRLASLPEAVNELEAEANLLTEKINEYLDSIEREKLTFVNSEKFVQDIEREYLEALIAVQFPDITRSDKVVLNRQSWIPYILPRGNEERAYSYSNAGSGGKKTLLKVCYALVFHCVAAENQLPLPSFLIIDSPMKNISTTVNRGNYEAFYKYLLAVASGPMKNVQFILVDNEYPGLESDDLAISDRKMTLNDPEYPRLISYYRGE